MDISAETAGTGQPPTQDGRLIAIDTPLGKDRLLLTSLVGEEGLSEPFRYDLEALSEDRAIAPERLVGTEVALRIRRVDGEHRHVHGVVARLSAGPLTMRRFRTYRLEVVPWLWLLSHSSDCRIFQGLSVPEILERVFQDHGFRDFEMRVERGGYPKLDFCVQYRETALDFVSRLMEREGLFYFFRHEARRHVLVVADANAAFPTLPEARVAYSEAVRQAGEISEWRHEWAFRPGRRAQRDFDFERPSADLLAEEGTVLGIERARAFERYDYPGGYTDLGHGRRLARALMQADEAAHHVVAGASECASFCPGGKFTLSEHPVESEAGRAYVVRRVRHEAREGSHFAGLGGGGATYANAFEVLPAEVPFRPARTTPRPVVEGPQTAIVTGPAGEEIHTDRYGRVKLHFHWDRHGPRDENSSCWVRVSHPWAGGGYGAVQIPRVGEEVIVSFLEGDPDRPSVTGRVYNAEQMPPHGLPGAAIKSGIKSRSSKGGGGSNELTFDDTKGKEHVYFHSQYDLETVVEQDESHTVVSGNRKLEVRTGTHTENIQGETKVTVKAGSYFHNVQTNTAMRKSQGKSTIESDTEIELKAGEGAKLTLKSDGTIELKGANVTIEGSGVVTVRGKPITLNP